MTVIRLAGFRGANRAVHPKLLPDVVGVTSLNQFPGRGDLRPLKDPLTVAAIPAGRNTIYRMGQDTASDTTTWLSWTGVVNVVRGFIADDTTERTYYTGDGAPKWTDNVKLQVSPRTLGVPAPTTTPTVTSTGGVSTTTATRFYVYTYVTDASEESAPSPVSTVQTGKVDATWTISNLAAAPSGNYGITLIRVYRTESGTTGTDFYYVGQVAVPGAGTTSFSDTSTTVQEPLATATWIIPPASLTNLTGMWNGMMAGISGKSVRVCEAYVPYAWPAEYELIPPDGKPVALGVFGQSMVVLTTNKPRLVTGGSPESLDDQPLEFRQSCVAARSVVSMGHGVVYAAPDGLAYIGAGGARILTQGLMTRADWQAIIPSTLIGGMYEGMYVASYNDGSGVKGLMIDPLDPQGIYFLDFGFAAAHVDAVNDALFVVSGTSIKKWNAGSTLSATFVSKVFMQPALLVAPSCGEVVADAYPVTFKLYADGVLKNTTTVSSREPFRLPAGYYAKDYQIELVSANPVQYAAVAHSFKELSTT